MHDAVCVCVCVCVREREPVHNTCVCVLVDVNVWCRAAIVHVVCVFLNVRVYV